MRVRIGPNAAMSGPCPASQVGGVVTYIPLQNSHSQDKAPAPIWGLTIPPRPDGSLRHGGSSLCHSAPKRDSGSTPQAAQPIQKSGLLQGRGKTGRPLPRRREASAATPRLHRYNTISVFASTAAADLIGPILSVLRIAVPYLRGGGRQYPVG